MAWPIIRVQDKRCSWRQCRPLPVGGMLFAKWKSCRYDVADVIILPNWVYARHKRGCGIRRHRVTMATKTSLRLVPPLRRYMLPWRQNQAGCNASAEGGSCGGRKGLTYQILLGGDPVMAFLWCWWDTSWVIRLTFTSDGLVFVLRFQPFKWIRSSSVVWSVMYEACTMSRANARQAP